MPLLFPSSPVIILDRIVCDGVFFGWLDDAKGDATARHNVILNSVRPSPAVRSLIFANRANSRQWRCFNTLENLSLDVSLVSTGRMSQKSYLLLVSMISNHFIREKEPFLSLLLLDGFHSTAVSDSV